MIDGLAAASRSRQPGRERNGQAKRITQKKKRSRKSRFVVVVCIYALPDMVYQY